MACNWRLIDELTYHRGGLVDPAWVNPANHTTSLAFQSFLVINVTRTINTRLLFCVILCEYMIGICVEDFEYNPIVGNVTPALHWVDLYPCLH